MADDLASRGLALAAAEDAAWGHVLKAREAYAWARVSRDVAGIAGTYAEYVATLKALGDPVMELAEFITVCNPD